MKRFWISLGLLIGCSVWRPAGAWSQGTEPQREELPPPQILKPAELPPPIAVIPAPPASGGSPSCPCPGRTISVPRMTLMEVQEATTIPQMRVREEVVGHACGLDVEYKEHKQVVCEWKLKPREVIQEVPCTTMVPVKVTDPCTGLCRTEYKSCPIVRAVKVIVYDAVPEERVVVVAVPCLKPGKPLEVRKLCVDTTLEPAICTRLKVLTMPNEVHVPSCCTPPCPH
jgi:hypothetical protein